MGVFTGFFDFVTLVCTCLECGLKNFAKKLLNDYEAVNNAVITTVSNGQVEGQVNRVKNIKRRMYGRAGFELLRKMVIVKSV